MGKHRKTCCRPVGNDLEPEIERVSGKTYQVQIKFKLE